MDKAIKYAIAIGIIVVALSVAYYLVIFLPQKEKNRLDMQKQQEATAVEKQKQDEDKIRKEEERISQVRTECNNYAREKTKERGSISADDTATGYHLLYEACFKEKGLNP